jgi:hypothetical protein
VPEADADHQSKLNQAILECHRLTAENICADTSEYSQQRDLIVAKLVELIQRLMPCAAATIVMLTRDGKLVINENAGDSAVRIPRGVGICGAAVTGRTMNVAVSIPAASS